MKKAQEEFDFHFVTQKDTETKAGDGSITTVTSEVVARRLKRIIAESRRTGQYKERKISFRSAKREINR